jgi:hypothetical protein
MEGLLPEEPGEAFEDRLFAFCGRTPPPPAGVGAQDEAGQDARVAVGVELSQVTLQGPVSLSALPLRPISRQKGAS